MPLAQSNANGIPFGGQAFDPSSIKVDGVKTLQQQLLTKQTPTIAGVITDESKNKGDARDIQLGRCYLFDGVDDKVDYGNVLDFNHDDAFSIEVNVKWTQTTVAGILSKSTASTAFTGYQLYQNTGQVFFRMYENGLTTGFRVKTTATSFNDDAWHKIHLIYDGSSSASGVTIYVDDIEQVLITELDAGFTGVSTSSASLTLGDFSYGGGPLACEMYGVKVWDGVGDLVFFAKCDEGGNVISLDGSGNNTHGTITNATLSTFHATQDVYSYQNEVGYSTNRMVWTPAGNEAVVIPIATSFWNGGNTISLKAVSFLGTNGNRMFERDAAAGVGQSFRALLDTTIVVGQVQVIFRHKFSTSGDAIWETTNPCFNIGEENTVSITYDSSSTANDPVITVNGVVQAITETVTPVGTADAGQNGLSIGNTETGTGSGFGGTIYDLTIGSSTYEGYGITLADWEDLTGSNDATSIVGSPATVYLPRDESSTANSILGLPLQFTGRVPYNAKAEQSNCITLNGTTQYGQITGMTASGNYFGACTISTELNVTDAVTAQAIWALGAAAYRLYINAGVWTVNAATSTSVAVTTGVQKVSVTYNASGEAISFSINDAVVWTGTAPVGTFSTTTFFIGARDLSGTPGLFFNGSIWNFSLSGSSVKNFAFNMAEGSGIAISDTTGNGNHGTLFNSPTWAKQDTYHSNLVDGFSRYNLDGVDDRITFAKITELDSEDFTVEADIIYIGNGLNQVLWQQGNTTDANNRIACYVDYADGNTLSLFIQDGTTSLDINTNYSFTTGQSATVKVVLDRSGNALFYVDDVLEATEDISSASNALTGTTEFCIGRTTSTGTTWFSGNIDNVKVYNASSTLIHSWAGGTTNASWVDLTGSNDGTVSGAIGVNIPALTATTDVFGHTLTNPAGAYHNGAETLIDFTNNVLSPEAVRNSWETAWAFNTARTNPEFKRTLTSGGVDHRADRFLAYRDALSGLNLTKVQNYTATKAI